MEVPRSSYCARRSQLSERLVRGEEREKLVVIIEEIFIKSRKSYGAVRVHDQLVKRGITDYSVKQVRRMMREKPYFLCIVEENGR